MRQGAGPWGWSPLSEIVNLAADSGRPRSRCRSPPPETIYPQLGCRSPQGACSPLQHCLRVPGYRKWGARAPGRATLTLVWNGALCPFACRFIVIKALKPPEPDPADRRRSATIRLTERASYPPRWLRCHKARGAHCRRRLPSISSAGRPSFRPPGWLFMAWSD